MKERFCDLHTHSLYSDGTARPGQILAAAEAAELAAVALCDHNTIAGLPEFLRAGKTAAAEAVAGVEITGEYGGKEIHILGLFLPEACFPRLDAFLAEIRRKKEEANLACLRRLRQAGYGLSWEKIRQDASGEINRVHFARELLRLGHISSVKEAFQGLLAEENGFYRPPERAGGLEVAEFLADLGCVPVLAHPLLSLSEQELKDFLPRAKARGLAAMETRYSLFDETATRRAEALAERFGLLQSGGSDFHGENKPDIALGTGRGSLRVPAAFFEELKRLT